MNDDAASTEARAAQARAAAPETFVWVSANAGSGKTHVLVERLVRLMLGGAAPSRILCLTFTNAAAAEMQSRLFERLADWALMEDGRLAGELVALTGTPAGEAELAKARRLFTAALESPGGLKIHTIHAFCTRLLQRFPLEAGVAPNFRTLDEQGQANILAGVREAVMADAAGDAGSALAAALATLSGLLHDMGLEGLFAAYLSRRRIFAALAATPDGPATATAALAEAFGVPTELRTEASVIAHHFDDRSFDQSTARQTAALLETGKETDRKLAPAIAALAAAPTSEAMAAAHAAAFFSKNGVPRKRFMTKSLRQAEPSLAEWVDTEMERAADVHRALGVARTLTATEAMLTVGTAVTSAYEKAKRRATLLDYDDLIAGAHGLLADSDDRDWVLYKLDGGIDHILVDEAQDTSPAQWEIVAALAEDMVSGAGARGAYRTVFAVGDEKQSIFSFQGADPKKFAEMRDHFASQVTAAARAWDAVPLDVSFRSTPEILAGVDAVFAAEAAAAGLTAAGSRPRHRAFRGGPGRIELWPLATVDATEAPDPWTVPVDYAGAGDPRIQLAREIADEIELWLEQGRELTPRGRAVKPGDILVLVRRRTPFVEAMVRELKARNVPVAGVDRMRLTEQLVVMDLMALARFATLPEDDYSLAAVLKSPLIGLTEDELFEIAHGPEADGRGGQTLWQALQAAAATRPRIEAARAMLADVVGLADRVPPFAFFAQVLAVPGRREAIFRRLGVEAADPIAEFLDAALRYELVEAPSLDGFVAWLARGELEIKRDMEHGADEVRIMTVHGAKGLEANIVILPDTCALPAGGRGLALVDLPLPGRELTLPVWPRAPRGAIELLDEARAMRTNAEADEYRRLLYVAMTRACDWLIVTGHEGKQRRPAGCWYDLIEQGLKAHFPAPAIDIGAGRLRYVLEEVRADALAAPAAAAIGEGGQVTLPAWALAPPVAEPPAPRLTPSAFAGDDGVLAGDGAASALSPVGETRLQRIRRGTLIHGLLHHLPDRPRNNWPDVAEQYLTEAADDLTPEIRSDLASEALRVLGSVEFAPFLGAGVRAEVPFAAHIAGPNGPILVEGRVDRVRLADGVLHVIDYKTQRPAAARAEEVAPAILRQMALYGAALGQLHGVRRVEVSVLWTDGARLMGLPQTLLDTALHEVLTGHRSG